MNQPIVVTSLGSVLSNTVMARKPDKSFARETGEAIGTFALFLLLLVASVYGRELGKQMVTTPVVQTSVVP